MGLDLSDRPFFKAQRDSRRAGLFAGPATHWKESGRWEIDLSRRLENADGSFAGALVGAYDPWALTNSLEQIDLGPRGLIALVGEDGAIRALVSPYEMPEGENIRGSAMFRAIGDLQQGVWTGPSAPDGIERVQAFRRLPDQDLTIVIGFDCDVALRDAETWATTAHWFASSITVAIVLMAVLLWRARTAWRARENRLFGDRAALEAAYAEAEAAKAQAEAQTAQLGGVLSDMSDGVMLLDGELRLVLWNERFPRYTGVSLDLLRVGTPMQDLLRSQALAGEFGELEDPEAEVMRRLEPLRARQDGEPQQRTRPDGRTIELRRTALPGGGFVTLYTDITARRQTEEARDEARRIAHEVTEQKASFVAVVSHEIRTPLNALVGSLALLDESGLSAAQRRLTNTAQQAGEALLALVNDILEMSKMEAGELGLHPTPFNIEALLAGVAGMFDAQAAARGIKVVVQVAPDLPRHLTADSGRLRQVLMNFVSNATKFAVPGTVTIRACATLASGQPCLLLGVRDCGPRVPEREAAQLFRPFSRLAGTRASGVPGTGLGLAISERLIRLMGGQVGIGPSPEGGNEFWATVPLKPAVNAAPGPPSLSAASLRRASRRAVLLVEDVLANQLVTAIVLRRAGHCVDVAESGAEALHMVQSYPYDLVFMDLVMPGMGGEEAARHIRALPGPAGRVPIVALTATTSAEDRSRCDAAGMDAVLAKPVRSDALLAMVDTCAQQRASPVARPAQAASLDAARLADLQGGLSAATLAPLIEQCLADIAERLPLLGAALRRGDAKAAEEGAHALAGMAASYGLAAVERQMRAVLAAARDGDLDRAGRAAQHADTELTRAAREIRSVLQPMAA